MTAHPREHVHVHLHVHSAPVAVGAESITAGG
jgi:hypothetical protein